MIYSLLFNLIVIILIMVVSFFVIYTAYLLRKYQFLQDKKTDILDCYNNFIKIYDRDTYFSIREFSLWEKSYKNLRSTINDYKDHINKLTEISDRINIINNLAKNYVNIFLLTKDYEKIINYLHSVFQEGLSKVKSRNRKYLETELEKYSNFFDDKGGNTLTDKQREIVIVDEANNLVVAGAGTGKTLTLVTKVGYILEKKLAQPNEILLLAFTNKAKEELEERIKKYYKVELTVHTFHSFGMKVIAESEGHKPLVSELSTDDILLQRTIEEFLKSRIKDQKFFNLLNEYFVFFLNPVENMLDFSSREGYEEYLNSVQIRTLKGEIVKSFAELEIANFLYINGVDYQYEREYIVDTSSEKHGQYKPDFYIPDGIWLEHIDIDHECNTAPDVDKWEYLDSWYEKRKIHKENFTDLLETYSYEHLEGNLLENLKARLESRGVSFKRISEEQIFERLKELGEATLFVGLLMKFLKLYKSSIFTIPELREKALKYSYSKRYQAFLDIFEVILEDYKSVLIDSKSIDFNDMIKKATQNIRNKNYKSVFKYILVDEFQDISQSRYRLLKELVVQNPFSKTFCVGDDWQSIYRFAGSDLSLMTNFEKYFEFSEIMYLDETFRFNEKMANFSSTFIMKNPTQYKKSLISKPAEETAVKLLWYDDINEAISQSLIEIYSREPNSIVYLLSRYKAKYYNDLDFNQIPFIDKRYQSSLLDEGMLVKPDILTVHSSKGKQADYVILYGLQSGRYGFPCEIEDDPVLNLVLTEDDKYPNAEERRVFYVGLTRAKNQVYLLSNKNRISSFVHEILSNGYELEVSGEPPKLITFP